MEQFPFGWGGSLDACRGFPPSSTLLFGFIPTAHISKVPACSRRLTLMKTRSQCARPA